ncbi:MAG: polysaccharide deacetylase family protein [Lachnospiraceae bacterium]|nr:polysaccharide deacetylase family protein [Lachnospiraceae bacterium]
MGNGNSENRKRKKSINKTLIIISAEFIIIGVLLIVIGFGSKKTTGNAASGDKSISADAQGKNAGSDDSGNQTALDTADKANTGNTDNSGNSEGSNSSGENGSSEGSGEGDIFNIGDNGTPSGSSDVDAVEKARADEAELVQNSIEKYNQEVTELIEAADLQAAMYDYDKAIDMIKAFEGYELDEKMTAAIARYEDLKSKCVKWHDNTQISHIFFHSLIYDTSLAFGPGSSQPKGYNQYMTTVSEFNKMMESMYEKGFVLVSIHDIARMEKQEDGTEKFVAQPIYLPEGKEPFVLSQDDVNYYIYMERNGFAEKLVVGEDGLPTCMYIEKDGSVSYGEYDVVPILDRFIREHPDFSYHGAKGILAVTGFEGALGYDTGLSMKKYDGMDEAEKMALINAEREEAIKVAEALKTDGWEFASHSYTHTNMTTNSVDKLKYDTRRWKEEVEIILGPTDVYIYPFGADICDWHGYKGEKFEILKEAGFDYFCNVDSARFWIQLRDTYFRMGRINLDGERMNVTPEKLTDFFNVEDVYDNSRPEFHK